MSNWNNFVLGATLHFDVELINIGNTVPVTNVFKEIDEDNDNQLSREEVSAMARSIYLFIFLGHFGTGFKILIPITYWWSSKITHGSIQYFPQLIKFNPIELIQKEFIYMEKETNSIKRKKNCMKLKHFIPQNLM